MRLSCVVGLYFRTLFTLHSLTMLSFLYGYSVGVNLVNTHMLKYISRLADHPGSSRGETIHVLLKSLASY